MNSREIKEVLDYLSGKGAVILDSYIHWYITASIIYMGIGALVTLVIWYVAKKFIEQDESLPGYLILGLGLIIVVVIILVNLVNLLSPTGIATHQLIKDLRGGH